MANLEKGNIVKFINSNNELDGGTIVGFGSENGNEIAIINTLEGKRVAINKASLIPIKHQRKGMAGAKMQKRLAKEIKEARATVAQPTPPSDGVTSVNAETTHTLEMSKTSKRAKSYTPAEIEIKILREKVEDLEKRNEELRKELETAKCPYEVEKLIKTIKALKQSIDNGIILSDDKSQAITPLLDLIMDFNNLS